MGINGDYSSMAEAVGEAPPRTGITGGEYEEILHDAGGDIDAAREAVEAIDCMQTRDYNAYMEPRIREQAYAEGYKQACLDHDIDVDD